MAEENGNEVGSSYISITPSAQGFSKKLQKEMAKHAGVFDKLGIDLGDVFSEAFAKETAKSKPKVKPELDDEDVRKKYQKLKEKIEKDKPTVEPEADTATAEAQMKVATRDRFVKIKAKMETKSLKAVTTSLMALSGARVAQNMLDGVKDRLMNLDQSVPKIALVTGAVGLLGATALASSGGLIALGGSLASISAAGLLLPGILGGAAIGALTMGLALSDTSKVLGDLGPKFKAFKSEISGNFWAQAEQPIRNMVSTLLPQFQSQMGVTATALGAFTSKFTAAFTGAMSGVPLASMFTGLNQGIKNAEAGIPGVTTALQVLGTTGASYLPRMGTWLSKISNSFGAWLKQAQASGALNQWIETALVNLRALGSVVASTGSILNGLFQATQAAGFGGLTSFADALSRIATVVNGPAFQGALIQVFQGAKAAMDGLAPAVSSLGQMFVNLAPVIKTALGSLGSSVGAVLSSVFKMLGSPAVASGLTSMVEGISGAFRTLAPTISALGPVVGAVFATIGNLAKTFAPIIGAIFTGLAPVLTQILGKLNPFISALGAGLLPVIKGVISVFAQWWPLILGIAGAIGGIVLAFKAYTMAATAVRAVSMAVRTAMLLKTAVLHGVAIAQGRATLSQKANVAAQYAGIAATKAWMVATKAAAVVQRVFNAAMRMNPIGLIITGIMLLVGALIWFFTKTKIGQVIFEKVWNGIKIAVNAVVVWFQTTVVPMFQTAINAIVLGFQKFKTWAALVWNGFKAILFGVWNWIKTNWPLLLGILTGPIGLAVVLIVKHWNKIKAAIAAVGVWFTTVLVPMFQLALTTLGNFFRGLYTKFVKPVFTWIRSVITRALNGAKLAFLSFKTGVTVIWNAFRTMLSTVWNWIRVNIFGKIRLALVALKLAFSLFKSGVSAIWTALKNAIARVWAFIRDKVFTPIKTWLVNTLKSAFNGFKNTVNTVFSKVKGFADTLWSGMKTIFGKLKDGASAVGKSFQTMKNTVKAAFEKARDTAKKPIKMLVGFVNDPLIKGINKVGNIFDLKDIPSIKLPKGFARGGSVGADGSTGGYTGPGRKFKPAGVVHAGEYVVKKSATAKVEKKAPGLLRSLNSGHVPGFASGGKVAGFAKGGKAGTLMDAADWWIAKGARGGRHSRFEGHVVKSGHSNGSLHYQDKAVDLNKQGTSGTSQAETNFFNKYVKDFKKKFPGIRTIWQSKNHYDHMHIDTSNGADIGDFSGASSGGGSIWDMVPGLSSFKEKIKEKIGGDTPFGKMVMGAGTWVLDGISSWMEALNPFGGGGGGGDGKVTSSANAKEAQAEARKVAKEFGWSKGKQWQAILKLVDGESSWDPHAANPGSSARGLFQKMTSMHGAVEPDVAGQTRWGLNYIKNSYGTPGTAYNKWKSRSPHWYANGGLVDSVTRMDNGGFLPKGNTLVQNATSSPERIRTMDEELFLQRSMAQSNREYQTQKQQPIQITNNIYGNNDVDGTANAVAEKMTFAMRKHGIGSF